MMRQKTENNHGFDKIEDLRYFQWGDEKPGFVTLWTLNEERCVKHLGTCDRFDLPKHAVFNCPYN